MAKFRTHIFTAQNSYRKENLEGKEYYVVPIIAMIEGVRYGGSQEFPELGLAENFGKFPDGWNTSPVVMNHPQDSTGTFLSAGTKDILETQTFGTILNTQLKGTKLHMEAWLDVSKRDLSPQIARVFERIETDEIVEVSVGFFCELQDADVEGDYNGEKYKGIWVNVVPDHLAILEEGQIGACSVAAGCGTRTQQLKEETMTIKTQCECSITPEQQIQALNALRVNTTPAELLTSNVEKALEIAINAQLSTLWSYIYTFSQNTVIYYNSHDSKVYQQSFDIDANYSVTLKNDAISVVTMTYVTPTNTITKGSDMTVQTEETTPVEETTTTPEETTTPVTEEAVVEEEITAQAYIEKAPAAIREVLEEGIRANNAKRNTLISTIKAHKANSFNDAFLTSQTTETLEKLAAFATPTAVYNGTAPATPITAQTETVPTAPKVFEAKK